MFVKASLIKTKIRNLLFRVFNNLENNSNPIFSSNGEEKFLDDLFLLFSKSSKKRMIFDIGANVGNYSEIIQKKAETYDTNFQLHVFEPTKRSFDAIDNKFSSDNIILNNFGASDTSSIAKIFYDREGSSLASLYQRNLLSYGLELDKSEDITLRRLDQYIESKNIDHIDFVKIDIEGHELKAFEGFGKYMHGAFIDYIQFEYGGANLDSNTSLMDIYKFMNDRGFKIAKIMPKGLELREYSPFMDNFQYSNFLAISSRILE